MYRMYIPSSWRGGGTVGRGCGKLGAERSPRPRGAPVLCVQPTRGLALIWFNAMRPTSRSPCPARCGCPTELGAHRCRKSKRGCLDRVFFRHAAQCASSPKPAPPSRISRIPPSSGEMSACRALPAPSSCTSPPASHPGNPAPSGSSRAISASLTGQAVPAPTVFGSHFRASAALVGLQRFRRRSTM